MMTDSQGPPALGSFQILLRHRYKAVLVVDVRSSTALPANEGEKASLSHKAINQYWNGLDDSRASSPDLAIVNRNYRFDLFLAQSAVKIGFNSVFQQILIASDGTLSKPSDVRRCD